MHNKVKLKGFSYGSYAEKDKSYKGFSLAEMLVVMLIMSFIAIGVPVIHFKKTELKTKRSEHGRYECYYDGNQLMQYSVNEEGAKIGPTNVTECKFKPPKNAIFFLVHAVGGGGGASTATGSISKSTGNESGTYTASQANSFPQWLKDVQGAGGLPAGNASFSAVRSGTKATITYGHSGNAGETVSMFFPNLSNVEITMLPGKGGELTRPGGETTVYFNGNKVITAPGGSGGSGSGSITIWLDGDTGICEVKELAGRKFNEADFASSIEMDTNTKMKSQMVDALAGSGGAGAYGSGNGTVSYRVNGADVGAMVKKLDCEDPQKCDDGITRTNCPAQAGKNGAVMILW